ncbi:MAG: futalosine hydrolase [Bacteroidota bacterium]
MKLLLTVATNMEIKMFLTECKFVKAISDNFKTYRFGSCEFDLLITGIGTTFTTFHLTQALHRDNYELVLNPGIAGSLTDDLPVGEVVNVVDEEFADLGTEEEDGFLTLFDGGFMNPDEFPFSNRILKADKLPYARHLQRVKGITANISHGRKSSINALKARFSGQVLTMEGAAVFYVCRWMGVPCLQLRAVSSFVAPRDVAGWDIPLALDNLKNTLTALMQEINGRVS